MTNFRRKNMMYEIDWIDPVKNEVGWGPGRA
jgi:hypothetical protein